MIRKAFTTFYQNYKRNKLLFSINILGLSTGIAAFLLIVSFLHYERSFDSFHPGADRIYRVVNEFRYDKGVDYQVGAPLPFGKTLKLDYPELEGVNMIFWKDNNQVVVMNKSSNRVEKKFKESMISMVTPEFFNMFSFKWLVGNPAISLTAPHKVVLSRSFAEKYFGDYTRAVGNSLNLDNTMLLEVSGVIENPPGNTDFQLNIVLSYASLTSYSFVNMDDWQSLWRASQCYIKLPKGESPAIFNGKLATFLKRHQPMDNNHTYLLQSLSDMHSDNRYPPLFQRGISKETMLALIIVALFLLILPSVNFINMQTAQAVRRSKEIGIYKVLGSSKLQLVMRFLLETFLTVLLAVLVGFGLALLALPMLRGTNSSLPEFGLLSSGLLITTLLGLIVIVTLLSGIYPAMILSNFKPTLAIKGKITAQDVGGSLLRRILVVFQFSVSQILIIVTIVALLQINYIQNRELGFNKEGILLVNLPLDSVSVSRSKELKQQITAIPEITSVALSSAPPLSEEEWKTSFRFTDLSQNEGFPLNVIMGDQDYLKTYQLKLVAGRFYQQSDTIREVVVNEQFLTKLGNLKPQDVIGKNIQLSGQLYPITGVVKDFNNNPLKNSVDPVALMSQQTQYTTLSLKMRTDHLTSTMDKIKNIWTYQYPDFVFESVFLDDKIARAYQNEAGFYRLFKNFSLLAIFISCCGLFALASFLSMQRSKEVGIRKVLGASLFTIIKMLSKEYVILFLISTVISWSLGWLAVSKYMQQFIYRISISPLIFVGSALMILIVIAITVSFHTLKAALINPTKILKVQ